MTERQLVKNYRRHHPASRAVSLFRFCHNGSSVKQRECILCGWRGPTWSAKWPMTVTAQEAEESHRRVHVTP